MWNDQSTWNIESTGDCCVFRPANACAMLENDLKYTFFIMHTRGSCKAYIQIYFRILNCLENPMGLAIKVY